MLLRAMPSINDDYLKTLLREIQSMVEKGNWPEIDSKPYAQLLCKTAIRSLEELDQAVSGWVIGKRRKLRDDDQWYPL